MYYFSLMMLLATVINPLPEGNLVEGVNWQAAAPSVIVKKDASGIYQVSNGEAILPMDNGAERAFKFGEGYFGRTYAASVRVSGSGTCALGVEDIGVKNPVRWSAPFALSESPSEIVMTGQILNADCSGQRLRIKVNGGEVKISGAKLNYALDNQHELQINPKAVLAASGDNIKTVVAAPKGKEITVRYFSSFDSIQPESERKIELGVFSFQIPADVKSGCRIGFGIDGGKVYKNLYVQLAERREVDELNAMAAQYPADKPLHILVIGDSLTDYHRGRNYIAMADGLLEKHHPGKVSFRNVACGGDFITRVCERLEDKTGSGYRSYMYKALLSPLPDVAIVVLGANDTKVSSESNYQVPQVTAAEQEKRYRQLIEFLHDKGVRRIALFNCLSFDAERMKKATAIAVAQNKKHNLFAVDEKIRDYNTVLSRLAAEYKLDIVDLYNASRQFPDKNTLFIDGVHLSDKGQLFMTRQVLQYLINSKRN